MVKEFEEEDGIWEYIDAVGYSREKYKNNFFDLYDKVVEKFEDKGRMYEFTILCSFPFIRLDSYNGVIYQSMFDELDRLSVWIDYQQHLFY